MSTQKDNKVPNYPVYEMKDRGTLILPQEVINQIMYLHSRIGDTEWSGILLYDVISGNPSKPSEFTLKAKHIFLMDIGTTGYTEYDTDGDIVDLYDKIPEAMQMKIGHVHSHHKMDTFFSGTDTDELKTNVDKYNYYLSLIVNFAGRYSCKVAFLSEVKSTKWMHFTDDNGELKKFKQIEDEKHMIVINMNIVLEYKNQFFYDRLDQVRQKKEEAKKAAERKKKNQSKSSSNIVVYSSNSTDTGDKTPDPGHLTWNEINKLTCNLMVLDETLGESRQLYDILSLLSQMDDAEMSTYLMEFAFKISSVLDAFFGERTLDNDDLREVIKEVVGRLNNYQYYTAYQDLVDECTDTLLEYLKMMTGSKALSEQDDINNTIDLDNEYRRVANGSN